MKNERKKSDLPLRMTKQNTPRARRRLCGGAFGDLKKDNPDLYEFMAQGTEG